MEIMNYSMRAKIQLLRNYIVANSETIISNSVTVTGKRPAQIDSVRPITTTANLDQTEDYNGSSKTNEFDIVALEIMGVTLSLEIR